MQTIELHSRVGPDGILKLEVPVAVKDTDVDVVVVVQPKTSGAKPEGFGWPPGFFEETSGSLVDDPSFMRHDQGSYEVREELE